MQNPKLHCQNSQRNLDIWSCEHTSSHFQLFKALKQQTLKHVPKGRKFN